MDIRELEGKDKIEIVLKQDHGEMEEGVSIKDIFDVLSRGKGTITLVTLIAFLLSICASALYLWKGVDYSGTAKALISFNYEGIEKGLDPHGKILDVNMIKAPVVLDRVLQETGLYDQKITTEDIRKNIHVEGIIPEGVIDRILTIKKMAEKDVTKLEQLNELEYHPTQYLVTLKCSKGLGLDEKSAQTVLNSVLESYRHYFLDTYADKDVLASALGELDYKEYDYPEIIRVMKGQIDIMRSYLKDKMQKSPDFRAKSTQMTFGDIVSYLDILDGVDVARSSSIISLYNITKDKDKLISLYEYRIRQYKNDMAKKQEEAKQVKEAANGYQKDKSVLLAPGLGTEGLTPFEFSQKNENYDALVNRAISAGVSATNYLYDIDFYTTELERLKNDTVLPEVKNKYQAEIEKDIESAAEKIRKWVDLVNRTVEEYYETEVFKDATKVVVPAQYESQLMGSLKQIGMIVATGVFVGFLLGLLIVWLREIRRTT